MKKILFLLFSFCLCFTLTACNDNTPSVPKPDASETPDDTPDSDDEEESVPGEDNDELLESALMLIQSDNINFVVDYNNVSYEYYNNLVLVTNENEDNIYTMADGAVSPSDEYSVIISSFYSTFNSFKNFESDDFTKSLEDDNTVYTYVGSNGTKYEIVVPDAFDSYLVLNIYNGDNLGASFYRFGDVEEITNGIVEEN